jgi:hypothetical protein
MKPRLAACYALLVVMLMCGLTVAACLVVYHKHGVRTLTVPQAPISNSSTPAYVESHFRAGSEYSQFAATAVGMKDGTCFAYTNGVSWMAMECYGGVAK